MPVQQRSTRTSTVARQMAYLRPMTMETCQSEGAISTKKTAATTMTKSTKTMTKTTKTTKKMKTTVATTARVETPPHMSRANNVNAKRGGRAIASLMSKPRWMKTKKILRRRTRSWPERVSE